MMKTLPTLRVAYTHPTLGPVYVAPVPTFAWAEVSSATIAAAHGDVLEWKLASTGAEKVLRGVGHRRCAGWRASSAIASELTAAPPRMRPGYDRRGRATVWSANTPRTWSARRRGARHSLETQRISTRGSCNAGQPHGACSRKPARSE